MKSKPNLKQIIVIAYTILSAILAILIFCFWKIEDLLLLMTWLIAEGTGVLIIFEWFRNLDDNYKGKESVRKEKEKRRLEHSDNYIRKYFKYKVDTHIDFDYTKCDLQLQIENLDQSIQNINDYDKQVCEYVNDHLKNGYAEVWDTIIKRDDDYIKSHNNIAKQFLSDLKSKILSELQKIPNMDKWNQVGDSPPKYFTEYLENRIGCSIIQFYKYPIDIGRLMGFFEVRKKVNDRWEIYNCYTLIVSDETEIRMIQKKIVDIICNELINKFSILKKLFDDANNEHTNFKKEMRKIKINVDGGIPLKKECDVCKDF